jgi:cytochrome c553
MRISKLGVLVISAIIAQSAFADGDPVAGAQKAALCIGCHGNQQFPGVFPLVQLAGRDTDKLVIKINKYRDGKLFSPMMTMVAMGLSEKDAEDIAAYYHSLGKPAFPIAGIHGDEDILPGR